jgi:hypothetical protein
VPIRGEPDICPHLDYKKIDKEGNVTYISGKRS